MPKTQPMPFLAGAIVYNRDENDLTIIDCLLKAGALINLRFAFTIVEEEESKKNPGEWAQRITWVISTPLFLAQELNKQKIVARLNECSEQRKHKFKENLDKIDSKNS